MYDPLPRIILMVLFLFPLACFNQNNSGMDSVKVVKAFPNLKFKRPVDLQDPRDGTDRLFVVEQRGTIQVFDRKREVKSKQVFLDLRDRVRFQHNEEGLLGLAFHPKYKSNGYFYVNYTASRPRRTVVSRFKVSTGSSNRADKNSEKIILEFKQPYGNHNGGQVSFGPDGYLYIATGDGGAANDPHNNGQKLTNLLGKILRIDVDKTQPGKAYAIPKDNPFASSMGRRGEIYAYGLRNPWRFSWDTKTGKMWTADVGQNKWEEVDIIEKGKNYGWNIKEGKELFRRDGRSLEGLVDPVWVYPRGEGVSVTGGFVYRGKDVPPLKGKYIYADYYTGKIWGLTDDGKGKVENVLVAEKSIGISSFGVDGNGEVYILGHQDGYIYWFQSS